MVHHRLSSNSDDLSEATELVRGAFVNQRKFQAQSVLVATWVRVGYFNRQSDRVCMLFI